MSRMTVDMNILDCLDEMCSATGYIHALLLALSAFPDDDDIFALNIVASECALHLKEVKRMLEEGQKTARKLA